MNTSGEAGSIRRCDLRAAWLWPRRLAPALAIVCLLAAGGCRTASDAPRVTGGILDLASWDFGASGLVPLEGRWEICWGELIAPGEPCPDGWQTAMVKGLWTQGRVDSPLGGRGVATYRVRIERPPGKPHLSLRAGSPSTAHRLWIDGTPRAGAGVVGATAAATTMGMRNHVLALPSGDATELWLQVANFEFRSGGLRRPWLLGRPSDIQAWVNGELLRDALLLGTTLVTGLIALFSFSVRPSLRARGYFALFALVVGIRSIAASPSDLGQLLAPWAPYAWMLRWEYACTAIGIFAALGYFRTKVEGIMPQRTMRLLQLAAASLLPIQLLAPLPWALTTLYAHSLLALLTLGLVLLFYGRAWRRDVSGIGATLAASGIYLFAVAHDVLRVEGWGTSLELSPYFAMVWILVEVSDQIRDFHRNVSRVELLSAELEEANFELRETEAAVLRFVPVDFLRMLGRRSIREIESGDHVRSLMSVVHCEIDAFASILERMPPEDAFRFTNALIGRLEPCITGHEGFVSQYRDDGLQCIFPTGAEAALAAAIALRSAVGAFNRESHERGRPQVEVGIGIDTGPLLLGTLGGGEHLSGGVLGEPVAAAPRIAAVAGSTAGGLLVTSRTRDCLSEAFVRSLRATDSRVQVGSRSVELFEVPEAEGEEKPVEPRADRAR